VEQAAKDLGRNPDLVFLHNPEQSLRDTGPYNQDILMEACEALDHVAAEGLCAAWGISSWEPSPLLSLLGGNGPRPAVLMVRAGLLVGARALRTAESFRKAWGLNDIAVWGMSPFGGSTSEPVWAKIDPRVFLRDSRQLSRLQAAFRAAYHLPQVDAVAVGTDDPAHLGDLVGALAGEVDERAVEEYRSLLQNRSGGQSA
jgi:aryl-alcohol dehydrogenase-like predicted oxidoreductase